MPDGDAKGQTLYEKIANSRFLLGDGKETEHSPDLSGERSGPVGVRRHIRRKLTIGAKRL
jgi:hypothetical protein